MTATVRLSGRSLIRGCVLAVDDDPDTREIYSRHLGAAGLTVFSADSAHGCFELIEREQIDLVLLDVMMPEMDGLKTLRLIKENAKTRDIPVIIVTVLDDAVVLAKALELGAEECLIKPVFKRQLLKAVRAHISTNA
jgi:putative two-component system response regulator